MKKLLVFAALLGIFIGFYVDIDRFWPKVEKKAEAQEVVFEHWVDNKIVGSGSIDLHCHDKGKPDDNQKAFYECIEAQKLGFVLPIFPPLKLQAGEQPRGQCRMKIVLGPKFRGEYDRFHTAAVGLKADFLYNQPIANGGIEVRMGIAPALGDFYGEPRAFCHFYKIRESIRGQLRKRFPDYETHQEKLAKEGITIK
jgi:hypothetical protein